MYKQNIFHEDCFVMNTRLNVVLMGDRYDHAQSVFNNIAFETERLENKMSRFSKESEIYRINRLAAHHPVNIDMEMTEIISLCLHYYDRTNGAFDITINPYWEKYGDEFPSRTFKYNDINQLIHLDKSKRQIRFKDAETQIDLGGFGKGYALEKIRQILKNSGIKDALISFGESSVLAVGQHPFGNCWKLGVENTFRPGDYIYVFNVKNESISTTGFRRSSYSNTKSLFHVISPYTGDTIDKMSTVTVKSKNCLDAEILSTAVFASLKNNPDFLENFPDCEIIEVEYDGPKVKRVKDHKNKSVVPDYEIVTST